MENRSQKRGGRDRKEVKKQKGKEGEERRVEVANISAENATTAPSI